MNLTVAICTWNRANVLEQTLAKLEGVRVPENVNWELLVVNNCCTDHTDDVLERYVRSLPLKRLYEPQPGLSNARNCAVDNASGDWIIWTDDDVLVSTDWLAAYTAAFAGFPEDSFFGGPVEPWFEGPPPKWLADSIWTVGDAYALRRFGDQPVPLHHRLLPFGANYAIRTSAQKQYRYDARLGHIGNSFGGGDETTMMHHLLDSGHSGHTVPEASVRHFIPKGRQTVRHLRRYYWATGKRVARGGRTVAGAKLLGRPRWLIKKAIVSESQFQFGRWFSSADRWLPALCESTISWGQLYEWKSQEVQ